jgi:hypothetical protein
MALKIIAYGTMPHAFLDYFRVGEGAARRYSSGDEGGGERTVRAHLQLARLAGTRTSLLLSKMSFFFLSSFPMKMIIMVCSYVSFFRL